MDPDLKYAVYVYCKAVCLVTRKYSGHLLNESFANVILIWIALYSMLLQFMFLSGTQANEAHRRQ